MNTVTHTPGEWVSDNFQIIAKCNGFKVADVTGPSRKARGKEWQGDMDCCQANASLLAAAPDLLAALIALDEAFCNINEFSTREERHGARIAVIAARAAVAKAKGVKP